MAETRAQATDAPPPVYFRSPTAICRSLRADIDAAGNLGRGHCRVVRRASSGPVHAAALLLWDERHEEVVLAAERGDGRWQVIRRAATAYSYQGLVGSVAVRSLRVRHGIDGGAPEVEADVTRWQGELSPSDGCAYTRQRERHRYYCTIPGDDWACLSLQVGADAGRYVAFERPCTLPSTPPPAAWSIDVRFSPDAIEVTRRAGSPPAIIEPWFGTHPLSDALPRGSEFGRLDQSGSGDQIASPAEQLNNFRRRSLPQRKLSKVDSDRWRWRFWAFPGLPSELWRIGPAPKQPARF